MKDKISFKKGEIENIIKEEEAFTLKITKSVQKDTGKFNDDYYKEVTKKFKEYNEPLKATEKENSDAVVKYQNDDDAQEYVELANYNQGSIINLIPDNNPGEDWLEKQRQAITGEKSIQGNSVDYSNVYQEEPGFKGKKANQEIYDNNKKYRKKTANAIKSMGIGDVQLPAHQFESENKKQVKMKRLRFKKPFTGVENALRLIPESYKVDNKTFQMTDGNEKYEIRWEGNINEGRAIILKASDKVLMNEDMQKMKHLMQYNSKDTLGNLRGKERINENKVFNDVWNKTKSINEIFGFGKKKPQKWEVANKYVPQLKELYREMKSHKGNLIDYEMISDARMTLMKFNDILDEILNDKDAELYKQYYPDDWGGNNSAFEWLESTKRNVEKDSSGRNRPNGLYLGDTS